MSYETDNIHVELQWQRGFNIFNSPSDGMKQLMDMTGGGNYVTVNTPVQTNMGDIDWYGGVVQGRLEKLGIGTLTLFASAAMTRPTRTHTSSRCRSSPWTP